MKRSMLSPRLALALFAVSIASIFACSGAFAQATYYVSPSGNDANNGLSPSSPWQTVARVNASHFNPGDAILFQRGGQWHESLDAPSSGAPGNPITFADYGTGAKPKFWGSIVLNNALFQPQGNGIYSYPIATPVYSVLVNHAFFNYSFGQPASTVPGSWFYDGTQITINSPNSDPRYNGSVYTAVQRDDVIYSNYQNHLVFNNLVADESARYDDNGGYGFRIMGSQDVLVTNCEAYHAGKHHFGVINSTQFIGTNLNAAYAAPGQEASGGASAYVSYGDTSTGLYAQTSEWHNVAASNMGDPQDNTVYYTFITHGATITSLWLDHVQSNGANVSFTNEDNPSAAEKITGGVIQNARLELGGSGILVDGLELNGPQATIDIAASNTTLQNILMYGTNLGSAWYQTAILSRESGNILRFSTIVMDPNCWTNTPVALTQNGEDFQFYGNILMAPLRNFALWDVNVAVNYSAQPYFNLYAPNTTFADFIGGPFNWVDIPFVQWQALGFDYGSLVGSPMFVNAAANNYQLSPGSPAINAALLPTSLLSAVPVDFNGNPRLQGPAFDMGAFEGTGTPAPLAFTTTTLSLSNNILTAQVTASSGTPTGSVNFYDGSNLLNTVTLTNGAASTGVSLDPTQAHTLTAAYSGDSNDQPSTSQPIDVNPVTPPAPAPPPAPPAPTPAPAPAPNLLMALTYPVNGQTVSGAIVALGVSPLTLDAAGSYLIVDGVGLGDHRVTNAPYTYTLDTTQLTNGSHNLQIWAHDISNSTYLSNVVTINVAN